MGEFVLTYEAVRTSPDPRRALLDFLDATYARGGLGSGSGSGMNRPRRRFK